MDNEQQTTDNRPPLGRPLGTPFETPQAENVSEQQTSDNKPLDSAASPPEEQIIPKESNNTILTKKANPKAKGKRSWLIAIIVFLVIAIGAGAAYYFMNQKNSRPVYIEDEDEDKEAYEDEERNDVELYGNDDKGEDSNEEPNIVETPVEAAEEIVEAETEEPRQLILSGDADGYPLTLTLTMETDDKVTGTYKNETTGTSMAVSGKKQGDAFVLAGRSENIRYTFRIRPEGHIYSGTLSAENGRDQELHLVAR